MQRLGRTLALTLALTVVVAADTRADTVAGRWDAVVTIGDAESPRGSE